MDNEYYKRYEPFFGAWYIKRYIGAGSYGKVFEIERRDEFDTVFTGALKAITIPSSPDELEEILSDGMDRDGASTYFRDYVKDLNREIALMSKLKGHSNIVSYEDHAIHAHEDGIGWDILIRMELLTPITGYLKQNKSFTRREIIRLGIDLCRALEVCQRYNIIHRDIKPANIFISETEDFKLGDFGVARIASASTGASTRAGTVNYMAPEVFKGEKYTSNVDIYSLGLVMYQLLNANRMPLYPPYPQPMSPAQRERAQAQRLSGAALPPPANADGRLAEIVLKACAPDPAQRYDSPAVMRQALEAILYTEGEARVIYPGGDAVPVPGTSGTADLQPAPAPAKNVPDEGTIRPVPVGVPESPAQEPETADSGTIGAPVPSAPQEPAVDQTVRVEAAQPAAPADDRTVRLMPGAAPVQTPAEDHTERVAVPVQPVQNVQESDKTTFLFEAQAEKRRQEQQAKREAEEAARRKAAEEKEAELARIRAEKRAAEQAAAEEAARKAEAEQAAAAQAAQQQETPAAPAAPQKKGSKLPLAIGGVAVAAVVAVGGFALAGRGGASGTAAASTAEAIYTAGTYTATAEGCLSDVTVTVTVSDKAITDVRVDASGETAELGGKAAEELPGEIIRSQSTDVDGYTGATLTSDAIKKAAADCIAQASGKKAASSQAASAAASSTVASSTTASSLSQNAADLIDSGSCGKNATWELYKDGTLYIKGTGAMTDYDFDYNTETKVTITNVPWYATHLSSIKKIVIESGITHVGAYSFMDCDAVTEIELPDTLTTIGENAFWMCDALKAIKIPSGVTEIGEWAFSGCLGLTEVELPEGLKTIGHMAFNDCGAETVTIPGSVKKIPSEAFWFAYAQNVVIEEGVEEIGEEAFYYNDQLKSVTIPRSVKKIDSNAFAECPSLKSVTISKNCNVASNAFPSTVQINYYD